MITFENTDFRLTLGDDCAAKSLVCLATGEELLMPGEELPLFSVTQDRPFNNEIKLSYPNTKTTFPANRVTADGDLLTVGFELINYLATVRVKIAPHYIAFTLEDFIVHPEDFEGLRMNTPPVASFSLATLPVKERKTFGEWLNVADGDGVSLALLACMPETDIHTEKRHGYRVFHADAVREQKLIGTTAALLCTKSESLPDAIETVEKDFDLPAGVASRKGDLINASIYWMSDANPDNIDENIARAKQGGFRMMLFYSTCFFKNGAGYELFGDYDYQDCYPEGKASVKKMLDRVKAAGITPGMHVLQTHIGIKSRYVTPVADPRLHKTRYFRLAKPIEGDELFVEENPAGSAMADRCRILQFGGELISYEGYTTERPYRFTGIVRGALDTTVTPHPCGEIGGVLDVSEYGATSVYLDQDTSLADEIGDKLADLYSAGFRFLYLDGSEGTNAPYGYHIPNGQYRVIKKLSPAPLFVEGAAKAHFSWHFLSGGNAFDTFRPEIFKAMIAKHPFAEAPRMRRDLTRLNFGWWNFRMPSEDSEGSQPDLYEYGTSRAAAWDCPATLMGYLEAFNIHKRTDDCLEAIRRWEDLREKKLLTAKIKEALRVETPEHHLLIGAKGGYTIVPWKQLEAPKGVRAFLFRYDCKKDQTEAGALSLLPASEDLPCVVAVWHTRDAANLSLSVPNGTAPCEFFREFTAEKRTLPVSGGNVTLPISDRSYFVSSLSEKELEEAFRNAVIE